MIKWLERKAVRFLERRGYRVLPDRFFMLAVSGQALVLYDEDANNWTVNFPVSRDGVFLGAFNGSLITTKGKEHASH